MGMYRLLPQQKQACEAVWRAIERGEMPMGLAHETLPSDVAEARYHVAVTIRMLPLIALPRIVQPEVDAYGPLRADHKFEWTERDMRAPGRPPMPEPPRG